MSTINLVDSTEQRGGTKRVKYPINAQNDDCQRQNTRFTKDSEVRAF